MKRHLGRGEYTAESWLAFENAYKEADSQRNVVLPDAAKKTVEVVKGVNQKSVVIPATVTKNGIQFKVTAIGTGAFKGFAKVIGVTIGKNVKTIGKQSFFNCKKLGKITLKGTAVPSVKQNAFKGTKAKIQVKVPKNMKAKQKNSLKTKLKKAGISSKVTIK